MGGSNFKLIAMVKSYLCHAKTEGVEKIDRCPSASYPVVVAEEAGRMVVPTPNGFVLKEPNVQT